MNIYTNASCSFSVLSNPTSFRYKNLLLNGGLECATAFNTALGVTFPRMLTLAAVRGLKKTLQITIFLDVARDRQLVMPFEVNTDLEVTRVDDDTDLAASKFMSTGDVITDVGGNPATVANLEQAFADQTGALVRLQVRIVRSAAQFNALSFFDEAGRGYKWVVHGRVRASPTDSPLG